MHDIFKIIYVLVTIFIGFSIANLVKIVYGASPVQLLILVVIFIGSYLLYKNYFKKNRKREKKTTFKSKISKSFEKLIYTAHHLPVKPLAYFKKQSKQKSAKVSKYSFGDVFHSLIFGTLVGLVPWLIFGPMAGFASLSNDSIVADTFKKLGIVSMIICIVIFTIKHLKTAKRDRLQKEILNRKKEFVAKLPQKLTEKMAVIEQGCTYSYESMEKYAKACEDMIYFCTEYLYDSKQTRAIVEPYYRKCCNNSYIYVKWCNGKYEYVPGTDLGEEIQKELSKRTNEILLKHGG